VVLYRYSSRINKEKNMRYLFIVLSFALLFLGVACEKGAAGPLKEEPAKEEVSKEKAAPEAKADAGAAKADAGAAKTDAGKEPAEKGDEPKEKAK